MENVDLQLLSPLFLAALREDLGSGDITSRAVIPAGAKAHGRFTAKQALVVAGIPVAREIVRLVDPALDFKPLEAEGASVAAGPPHPRDPRSPNAFSPTRPPFPH